MRAAPEHVDHVTGEMVKRGREQDSDSRKRKSPNVENEN